MKPGKLPLENLASYNIDALDAAYEVTIRKVFKLMEALAEAQQNARTVDGLRTEARLKSQMPNKNM